MEKLEIKNRLYSLCSNPSVNRGIIAYLELDMPQLAQEMGKMLSINVRDRPLMPHHIPWEVVECQNSPRLHDLAEQTVFVEISNCSEFPAVSRKIRLAPVVILDSVVNNTPFSNDELLGISICTGDTFFFLKKGSWSNDIAIFNSFIASLLETNIYMYYGKRAIKLIKEYWRNLRPEMIVDHSKMAEIKNMRNDIRTLSKCMLSEEFCMRSTASPREKGFTKMMRYHMIMRDKLLIEFALPLLGTDEWEAAREASVKMLFGNPRVSFWKKKSF